MRNESKTWKNYIYLNECELELELKCVKHD